MSDLRVTQVCHRYHPEIGGVETHVQRISEELVKQGCMVEVLTTDPTRKLPTIEEIHGVTVRRFKSHAPQNAFYQSTALKKYLQKNSFDVLHAHNYHALPALYAAEAPTRLFIFTSHYHGSSQSRLRNLLLKPYQAWGRKIFKQAEWVICVSEYERQLILQDFTLCKDKLVVIPNGVELEGLTNPPHSDPHRLLYVGRLEKYKGVQHIIEALPQLPDYSLTVIGRGSYKPQLQRLAEKLGVNSQVTFKEHLRGKELTREYQSAGIFIMLSRFEAYGITTAEALSAGTPCIVARASALEEFIDNNTCLGIEPDEDITPQLIDTIHRLTGKRVQKPEHIINWREVGRRILHLYEGRGL